VSAIITTFADADAAADDNAICSTVAADVADASLQLRGLQFLRLSLLIRLKLYDNNSSSISIS
jgi:hypothetical protein